MSQPKSTDVATLDPQSYNKVVSHAKISDIRLINSKFDMRPEAVEMADRTWTFALSDQLEDWTCNNEKGELTGVYSYSASCLEGRKKLLTVTGRYLSSYTLSDLCNEEAGRQFLIRVGRFAAYPYFRSIFAAITQQSGLLLPPLPVISDGPRWVNSPADAATSHNAKPRSPTKPRKEASAD